MKKLTFISIALVFSMFFSCKQNSHENNHQTDMMNNDSKMMHSDSTMMNNDSTIMNNHKMMNNDKLYSCPMHPEVHGNKNDKCPKCGMDLKLTNSKTSADKK